MLQFLLTSYCLTCWGQAGDTVIKPLKSLYKQALKILDKNPNHFHSCRIIEKHKFLNFDNFRLYSSLCMVQKILNGLAPSVLRDFIHLHGETSVRSTRL